jgi:hypothetical protein
MKRHIFDEHCRRSQLTVVRTKVRSVAQVGHDWGERGWSDRNQIIPHLHGSGATFHTQDIGFFDGRLRHADYCLVCYDVPPGELAQWVLKFLRHSEFNTHAKRLGKVIKVSPAKIAYWELHEPQLKEVEW